jgi:hypothetical protein
MGPRTSLDDVEMRKCLPLPGLKVLPLGHPVCSLLKEACVQTLWVCVFHLACLKATFFLLSVDIWRRSEHRIAENRVIPEV